MDKNASIHLNGIEAIYESGRLYMDFILSTGERSSLPKPDTKNKVPQQFMFRGQQHVACSYSCYGCIGVIEIYEEAEREGNRCVGLRLLGRSGQVITRAGFTEDRDVEGIENDSANGLEQLLDAREEREAKEKEQIFRERTVKVVTVNDFERVVGVSSKTDGSEHYNLHFLLAHDNGDFATQLVGNTPESEYYNQASRVVVFGMTGNKRMQEIVHRVTATRRGDLSQDATYDDL